MPEDEMRRFPNATIKGLLAVEPGSLIYVPIGQVMVPGLKGLGHEEGDDVHVVFTLSSMPEEPNSPQMILPDESQRVLDLGKKWRIALPIDPERMKFRNFDTGDDACGVVVYSDIWFLRVMFNNLGNPRPACMDLSTGKVDFSFPGGKNVLFSGWEFTLEGSDNVILRWPE